MSQSTRIWLNLDNFREFDHLKTQIVCNFDNFIAKRGYFITKNCRWGGCSTRLTVLALPDYPSVDLVMNRLSDQIQSNVTRNRLGGETSIDASLPQSLLPPHLLPL